MPRKEWMTVGLAKCCEKKSKLYKIYKCSNSDEAKAKYIAYRNKLKCILQKAERNFYDSKLKNCFGDTKKTWNVLNKLINKSADHSPPCSSFTVNGSPCSDGKLITENFNNFFTSIGSKLASNIPVSTNHFSTYMPKLKNDKSTFALYLTTPEEIICIVNSLKSNDSFGVDEIPITIIKAVIPYIAKIFSKILNCCLSNGIFPDSMKIAKVCPIYKSGEKNDFTNYRPISLLPSFSKIFEKIVYNRLIEFINSNNVLSVNQYGFRHKHSTYMAVLELYNRISLAIDKNEFCAGIFIDLSKAFDTINHKILLEKLQYYGIRGLSNILIKSYLSNRKQFVNYNNFQSEYQLVSCGVPQGSILGPLLFILYINDITNCSKFCNFILYADDTNLLFSDADINTLVSNINAELITLSDWFRVNRLSLNVKKTNVMFFGHKKISTCQSNLNIIMDNEQIVQVESSKFLGVLIDSKLTFQQHISLAASKISKSLYCLNRVRNIISKSNLRSLYFSLIHPHLTYCIHLWGTAAKTKINSLFLLQKRALRIICKSGYLSHTNELFISCGILKLLDLYVYYTGIFMFKYVNNLLPSCCANLVILNNSSDIFYQFRSISKFTIPAYRTCIREKCIVVNGPKIWSSLPAAVCQCKSIGSFKNKITSFLLKKYCE